MQERHTNRELYFKEQIYTTEKYVIPYIEEFHPVKEGIRVLEIGCGEGGNLTPFLEKGCEVIGIDLNKEKVESGQQIFASHPNKERVQLICEDIFKVSPEQIGGKFDIVFMKDVIEHIPNQEVFMKDLKCYVKSSGVVFLSFPPWQNPFGGHQQICKNKWLSKMPWIHLLPRSWYEKLLVKGGENPTSLLEIYDTKLSLERFLCAVKGGGYLICKKTHFFINPNYEIKFGLKKRVLPNCLNIPWIRNFYTTCAYYLLK